MVNDYRVVEVVVPDAIATVAADKVPAHVVAAIVVAPTVAKILVADDKQKYKKPPHLAAFVPTTFAP